MNLRVLAVAALLPVAALADEYDTLVAQGKDAVSTGRFKEAERLFLKALDSRPGFPEALYGAGFSAMQLGRRQTALDRFEDVLKHTYTDPSLRDFHTLALTRIGEILVSQRRFDEALKVYAQGIKNASDNPELRYGYGVALRGKGQNEKALQQFEETLKLNAKHPGALVGKASIYYELGNVPEAFRLLDEAAAQSPGNPLPYGVMGAFYQDMKKPYDAHLMLGHYYFYSKDLKLAANEYRTALAIKETPEAQHTLGAAQLQLGQAAEAERHFRRAIDLKLKPADPAWAQLSYALAKQGRWTEAQTALRKALRENPKVPGYWTQKSWIDLQLGNKEDADAAARKALELDPNLALGYRYLGDAYSAKGQWRDAVDAYEKALSRDPNLDDVYVNLGWAYENVGDPVSAQRHYETFLRISTDREVNAKVRAQIELLKKKQKPVR